MRKFRTSLFQRMIVASLLLVAACFFGGAAFSSSGLTFLASPDVIKAGLRVPQQDLTPLVHRTPSSYPRSEVLSRLNEIMLTERAVSVSV